MTPSIKNYYKSTPPIYRKIGDFLLAVSSTIATIGVLHSNKWVAIGGIVCGLLGKFFTNLYTTSNQ